MEKQDTIDYWNKEAEKRYSKPCIKILCSNIGSDYFSGFCRDCYYEYMTRFVKKNVKTYKTRDMVLE